MHVASALRVASLTVHFNMFNHPGKLMQTHSVFGHDAVFYLLISGNVSRINMNSMQATCLILFKCLARRNKLVSLPLAFSTASHVKAHYHRGRVSTKKHAEKKMSPGRITEVLGSGASVMQGWGFSVSFSIRGSRKPVMLWRNTAAI